ncbi:Zn-ribbon domain-containing OB-fold protein [Novosphingobium sp. TH158]|uniref:Zn-ribbon domain-containing OB-fold protein n=1 Tax=Novosphingobium sp. TH158 TaxID=2067455 RepID=UPI000C7C56D0|nr:zinc ribbon domain-containing protein [Novosphingobium sp. TH158]PLK26960.1 DNA-binding protein [Novosphingobium sp. TH158]
MSSPRKLPELVPETAFFWTSGRDGVLSIQRCGSCGHWQHPPLPRCPACHCADLAPQPVSGRGRVATFTVNHQAWSREEDPRFVFAAIELAEQAELYVFSNVLCDPGKVHGGMAVAVTFEQQDDVWIPLFVPVQAHG